MSIAHSSALARNAEKKAATSLCKKIIIGGFGGQGVLSLGLFISYAALDAGAYTSWLPSYGPEMRGGTANCSVVISDKEIPSPVITNPDIAVVSSEEALQKFENKVVAGGILFINSDIIKTKARRKDITVYYLPVNSLAFDINPKSGNVIMFGILLNFLSSISLKNAEASIEKVFANKPNLIEINKKCLAFGKSYKN